MTKLAGSCQCGSITFTSELEPMFVNQCNCERCRKMFGVVQASAIFADHEVEFNGDPSIYTFEGGSGGKIHAHFCPICATKTHFYADALDGLVGIVLGTIDDNHKYPPNPERTILVFSLESANSFSGDESHCQHSPTVWMEELGKLVPNLQSQQLWEQHILEMIV